MNIGHWAANHFPLGHWISDHWQKVVALIPTVLRAGHWQVTAFPKGHWIPTHWPRTVEHAPIQGKMCFSVEMNCPEITAEQIMPTIVVDKMECIQ